MEKIRRQLTLFVSPQEAEQIEVVRRQFNPQQSALINSHVTLCREDEIENITQVLYNLSQLEQQSIRVKFGQVERFDHGKGVLMPATADNDDFQALRKAVLKEVVDHPRWHAPHITLMHPRNATCTDEIFEAIQKIHLPTQLNFKFITLIEQINGEKWTILETIELIE